MNFSELKRRWTLFRARRDAKKYNLDFEYKGCFRHQICKSYKGLKKGQGEIVQVPMLPKVGLYEVTTDSSKYGATGPMDWKFKFQGYLE